MVEEKRLQNLIDATCINFQFQHEAAYKPIFDILYQKIKLCDEAVITHKFEELWKMTSKEWNRDYGFRGYPSLAQWLEILIAKPLTEIEIEKKKKDYEDNMRFKASSIAAWVNDPNLSISFLNRYKNPTNEHLKLVIDSYCKVKTELPDERIKKMGEYLRKEYLQDKQLFFKEIKGIAKNQNQLLLT